VQTASSLEAACLLIQALKKVAMIFAVLLAKLRLEMCYRHQAEIRVTDVT
jgi:hypothetical protein